MYCCLHSYRDYCTKSILFLLISHITFDFDFVELIKFSLPDFFELLLISCIIMVVVLQSIGIPTYPTLVHKSYLYSLLLY